MVSDASLWKVLPHGPLEQLDENVWRMEGDLPRGALKRVMTVARRKDGGLVIHNGIAMNDEERAKLEALGTPAVLLVPNAFHRLDAPAYVQRYGGLQVLCPQGARAAVESRVPVHGVYGEVPLGDGLTLEHLDGVREREGVLRIEGPKGPTVVFNDMLFNLPHFGGVEGFVFRYLTASTGGPKISRLARLAFVSDKALVRAHLERLATKDLQRVLVAHQDVIAENAPDVLRAVAATL